MTEEQHIKIVSTTLRKWFPSETNQTLERVAEAVVTRVQTRIEMEMEEKEQGIVYDFDAARAERVQEPLPIRETLPPPPSDSPDPSLIVDPSSAAGLETLSDPGRFRARQSLKLPARANPAVHYGWNQDQLRDFLYENAPDPMNVRVEGRDEPISLRRNIEVQVGLPTVKLSYGLTYANQPTASQPNSSAGESLSPISIDTPVAVTISAENGKPDMDAEMSKLATMARAAFRPKPDHLSSSTPRRVGPLTYRSEDPHEDVGPMPNKITGKVW